MPPCVSHLASLNETVTLGKCVPLYSDLASHFEACVALAAIVRQKCHYVLCSIQRQHNTPTLSSAVILAHFPAANSRSNQALPFTSNYWYWYLKAIIACLDFISLFYLLQGVHRSITILTPSFSRTYVDAAGCPFTWWTGIIADLIFWEKISKCYF